METAHSAANADPTLTPSGESESCRFVSFWPEHTNSPYVPRPDTEREILGNFAAADGSNRLVTLRGSGGVGKSRLAIACALQAAASFRGGVSAVRLDNTLPSSEAFAAEIAFSLGLAGEQATPAGLIAALAKRPPTLLLLDNFESVACEEVRVFVRDLLHSAPDLRLLVTGREAVRLPDLEQRVSVDEMTPSEARTLYLRCRDRDSKSSGQEPESLDAILQLTGCIPLAVELIAAGINAYGSDATRSLLDSLRAVPCPEPSSALPAHALEPRHPDLTRCLEWSFQRLPSEIQSGFVRLGLFADAFTAEALEKAWKMAEPRSLLLHLSQAALVQPDGDSPVRYRLHRSVRDYALEKLKRHPDKPAIRQAFLKYYAGLVFAHRDAGIAANKAALDRERRNAFGASELAMRIDDVKMMECFAACLHDYLHGNGYASEALRLQEMARQLARNHKKAYWEACSLARLGDIAATRLDDKTAFLNYESALAIFRIEADLEGQGKCLEGLGTLAFKRSEYESAGKRFAEARPLFRQAGIASREVDCLKNQGVAALRRFDYTAATQLLEEALSLYRKREDRPGQAKCLLPVGAHALQRSDHVVARQHFEEALSLYQHTGDVLGEAECTLNLGIMARHPLDFDVAQERFEKALSLYRQGKSLQGEGHCLRNLGDIAMTRKDYATALQRNEEALLLSQKAGDLRGQAYSIKSLGNIALNQKHYAAACQRYEEALPLYRQIGDVLGSANCIRSLGEVALRRSEHDAARQRFAQALSMYERISEPFSIGTTHRMLARIARNEREKRDHLRAAREAWTSIQRTDLVQQLEKEFGRSAAQ